jgi:hypothetical protein
VISTKSVLANQNIVFNTILNLSETVKPQKLTTISNFSATGVSNGKRLPYGKFARKRPRYF